MKAAVAAHRQNSKAPKAVAARAEPQTAPRQKSSLDRKAASATKPEKKKMVLVASRPRTAQGWWTASAACISGPCFRTSGVVSWGRETNAWA